MIFFKFFTLLVIPTILIYISFTILLDKINHKDKDRKIIVDGTTVTPNEYISVFLTILVFFPYLNFLGILKEQWDNNQNYFIISLLGIFIITLVIAIIYVIKLIKRRD